MDKTQLQTELKRLIFENLYKGPIINNAHRGDVVEMMVLLALGSEWRSVGLGWNMWDLQRGLGSQRIRIQVKQSAARQLWGETDERTPCKLIWKTKCPKYAPKYNLTEHYEEKGWFCELIVIGIHDEVDTNQCDQMDIDQWKFMVVPTASLESGISLEINFHRARAKRPSAMSKNGTTLKIFRDEAIAKWPLVSWEKLKAKVESLVSLNRS